MIGSRILSRLGLTARARIAREQANLLARVGGKSNTDLADISRLELRKLFSLWSAGGLDSLLKSEVHRGDGYRGLAIYSLLIKAGFYEEAVAVRRSAHDVLECRGESLQPLDNWRVLRLLADWRDVSLQKLQQVSEHAQTPERKDPGCSWVIVGPRALASDVARLQLDRFSVVSLNRPPPEWCSEFRKNIAEIVIFLNNGQSRRLLNPVSPVRSWALEADLLVLKNAKLRKMAHSELLFHERSVVMDVAASCSEFFLVGSANMLVIAIAQAARFGVEEVYPLGFDLYTDLGFGGSKPLTAKEFESRAGPLAHDPLEQQLILKKMLLGNRFQADAQLLRALHLDQSALLSLVGGNLA